MTKPPVCWDRWRGRADQLKRQQQGAAQGGVGRVEPGLADIVGLQAVAAPAPDRAGQDVDRVLRQAERLADLADRAARAGRRRRSPSARRGGGRIWRRYTGITSSRRSCSKSTSISGGSLRSARDEALEQQVDLAGIDGGDAEAVADRGIGRRAAAPGTGFSGCGRSARYRARSGNRVRSRAAPISASSCARAARTRSRHMAAVAVGRADPGQPFEFLLRGPSFGNRIGPGRHILVDRAKT